MPKTKKTFDQSAYNKQYEKENYYRLNVVLPKDLRPVIDEAVSDSGMSKNAYIKNAILEKIEDSGTFTKEEAARVKEAATAAGVSKSQYIKTATLEKVEREEGAKNGS